MICSYGESTTPYIFPKLLLVTVFSSGVKASNYQQYFFLPILYPKKSVPLAIVMSTVKLWIRSALHQYLPLTSVLPPSWLIQVFCTSTYICFSAVTYNCLLSSPVVSCIHFELQAQHILRFLQPLANCYHLDSSTLLYLHITRATSHTYNFNLCCHLDSWMLYFMFIIWATSHRYLNLWLTTLFILVFFPFSLLDWTSTKQRIKSLAQGHQTEIQLALILELAILRPLV